MDLLDTPVRLVVKAPNQRVGDQTIDCALGWTVRKLKAYIAEVYPSKPKSEEQKLIYSGQLLHDHLTLKDVLRQYDHNNTHIVHLVCAAARDGALPEQKGDSIPEKEPVTSSTQPTNQQVNRNAPSNNDGVRQRHTVESHASRGSSTSQTPTTNSPTTMTTTFSNYPTVYPGAQGLLMTPEQMAQQMLWMQQMYTQYMTQYMQYAQQPNFHAMTQPTVVGQASRPQAPPVAPAEQPNIAPQAPRPAPANENVRMNAQGGPVDEEDEEFGPNHDWLDWFYISSRAFVLFSIVYFYSSLSRFLAVTLMIVMFYVYQTNWFQMRRRPRARREPREPAPEEPIQQPPPPPPQQPAPENNSRNDDNNNRAQQNAEAAAAAAVIVDDDQMLREAQEMENLMDNDIDNPMPQADLGPSIVTVTWTFISGFFSSLIPEQPARAN